MTQVGIGFFRIQRGQVVARGDALRQLAQFGFAQQAAQFGLAQQQDLQQLLGVGFQIGEQPHLLQRVGRQVLSLVNQHHHAQALRIGRK